MIRTQKEFGFTEVMDELLCGSRRRGGHRAGRGFNTGAVPVGVDPGKFGAVIKDKSGIVNPDENDGQ